MTASEKVAYLKGLMEGMELDTTSKEGKLFKIISEILEDLALDVEDIEENAYDLAEEIDALSDDLADIEDIIYDDDDEDDYDDEDEEGCYGCGSCCGAADGEDDEDPQFFEVTCPSCNKTITVDEDVLNLGSIQCPSCGEMMEFEFDEDDESDEDDGE